MGLITCTDCASQVSDRAASCPKCGAPIAASPSPPAAPGRRGKVLLGALFALGVFVVAVVGVGNSPTAKAKGASRSTIKICWEEQRRASLAPVEARGIAAACEDLENAFRTRYGVDP